MTNLLWLIPWAIAAVVICIIAFSYVEDWLDQRGR